MTVTADVALGISINSPSDIPNACDFFKDRSTNDDGGDKYLNADVSLQIEDREGAKSSTTKKTVRFYVNGYCGY